MNNNYMILSDVCTYILNILQKNCVPHPIQNKDQIAFCNQDNKSDFSLALVVYDIHPMDNSLFKEDALPLCIKFFMTAHSNASPEIRAGDELRILGKGVQVLAETSFINDNVLDNSGTPLSIIMEKISIDEKTKIINSSDGMKTAVFYSISPVLINTGKNRQATRVRNTE